MDSRIENRLLAEYVRNGSEHAFCDLLRRYVDLVYSSAVRLVDGDTHLAEDVAQTVFVDLAKLARTLPQDVMLGGWLHRHTCFVAATTMRGQRRRQARERQAAQMNALQDSSQANLEEVRPVLDEAIEQLETEDRVAIVLRFFEQLDFRSVGEAIGSTDEAAKKRVSRALDKLHRLLTARGLTLSATALAAGLAAEAVKAAPARLVASIAAKALATATISNGPTFSLLKAMTTSKLGIGLASAIVLAGAAFFAKQYQIQARLREENNSLRHQVEQLTVGSQGLSKQLEQGAKTDTDGQLRDLLRLRGEVSTLRRQLAETAKNQERTAPQAQRPQSPVEEQKQVAITKMRDTKVWLFAFQMYAANHQMQFPTNFDQVANYVDGALRADLNPGEALRNEQEFAQTTNQFEILYDGSLDQITNKASTIVMREREAWPSVNNSGWNRTYGFADGHTEVHKEEDGNFATWEAGHLLQKSDGP
jgi:RNA polymerase sigma factor (sigma-70 family)